MATQKTSQLADAILGTADGLHRVGILDDATHGKITLRHLGEPAKTAEPITGEQSGSCANKQN